MEYPWLQNIFDIPVQELKEDAFDFTWMNIEQKVDRMKYNYNYSIQLRLDYIKKIQSQNKKFRLKLLQVDDEYTQMLLFEYCKRNPLFYINSFVRTYNPRLPVPNIPFITYPFQDKFILDIIDSIEKGIDHRIEKSRDMWFSWLILAIASRWFLFKDWASLIWSYKQDYVDKQWDMDSAFERLRYMFNRLPQRLKPNDMLDKFMSISSQDNTTWISWDAWKWFWTWWRRMFVFLDEFWMRQFDKTALRKTKDLTNCRIFWWTPEWINNVYWKVMTKHKDYEHLTVKRTRLHRPLHPLKNKIWYEIQKLTRTKTDLAKEIDISYEDSVSNAVYPLFSQMVQIWKYIYQWDRFTYTWMDFWLDTNACIIFQKDFRTNSLYMIKAFKRVDRDIRQFWWLIIWKPTQWFTYTDEDNEIMEETKYYKYSNHFWDPYNSDNRSTVNKRSTIRSELWSLWIHIKTSRNTTLEERIKMAWLSFNRLFIDKSCVDVFESLQQSHYPQIKDNVEITVEKTKPVHDEHSHYRTAYEYFISNEPKTDSRFNEALSVDFSWVL